jgi:hypothetical protein
MRPKGIFQLLGWNPTSTKIYDDATDSWTEKEQCAEVVYYPKHNHLAIQPHPEWAEGHTAFNQWINTFMKEKGIDYEF